MTDKDQKQPGEIPPDAPELSRQVSAPGGNRRPLAILLVLTALVAVSVSVWTLTRPKGGLYGQVMINNEVVRRTKVHLQVQDKDGRVVRDLLETDAQGYYKIMLRPGTYRLVNAAEDPQFLKIGNDSLEIIRKDSPVGRDLVVADSLLDMKAVRVGRSGRILGPLEGSIIMPDEKFQWVPYPNASRYVIDLAYFETGSRAATATLYLEAEASEWEFAFTDAYGRPLGTEAFRALNPQHPTRSLNPGGVYRWTLMVFNEDGSLKTTSKPVSFSVSNTEQAILAVKAREAATMMELNRKMGVLAGRITKSGLPVKSVTFRITIDRVERQSGQRKTFPYLESKTDEDGNFEIPLEEGVYSVIEMQPQPGDTILDVMQGGAILIPGAPSAIYEVIAGQKAVLPDIQIVSSVKPKYPVNGQRNVDLRPTIEWDKFEDANRYQLTLHYIDEHQQRSTVLIAVTNQTSYTIERINLPPEMQAQLNHPAEGLKPGGHYSYHIIASKEPDQKLIFDRNKPPPQWIRKSESLWTDFYAARK